MRVQIEGLLGHQMAGALASEYKSLNGVALVLKHVCVNVACGLEDALKS